MRRRCFEGRVLVAGLALAASFAGVTPVPVLAQSLAGPALEELVYEMELDLSLNPTRADEIAPEPEERARVVYGLAADKDQWPSAVSLGIVKEGGRVASLCAGTVIDSRWVLTAAHCIFDRRRGGVKSLRAVTVYAKSSVPRHGEVRRVKWVAVHPGFAVVPRAGKTSPGLVNDIAILELVWPTTAPRQKLLAHAGRPAALAAGTRATVIGWGTTQPRRRNERSDLTLVSKVLVGADVPVADRSACDTFLAFPAGVSTEPVFCAGDARGGADACSGDSGGPIFVPGYAGEPLQAGVVSWGDGCAQPDTYGAYASTGHFEIWLRKRVPQAQWAVPHETTPALATISGARPGGPAIPTLPAHEEATAPVRLRILGLTPAIWQQVAKPLTNVAIVGDAEPAALIWDAQRQLILNDQGHRIAEAVGAGELQHAIDRRQALERLVPMSRDRGLDVGIVLVGPDALKADATYKPGTTFSVRIGGIAESSYHVVFNLTGTGKVQILKPTPYLRLADYPDRPSFDAPEFKSGVRSGRSDAPIVLHGGFVPGDGPFGAEHVVAVAGALPLTRLMPALIKAHHRLAVAEVMAGLASELKTQPLQVGLRGLYSARE